MRFLSRLLVFLVSAGVVWTLFLSITTLQFGERPEHSFGPVPNDDELEFVEANGIRFAYLEAGKGPLVLLFHGYPETARSWSAVQQQLANRGYRVVAPFMRGYPPSSFADNGDYSVGALSGDVIALIDALGADTAAIVGHDWGASAVYRAAMERPEKISALVALAIPHPIAIADDPTVLIKANHFIYYQFPTAERLVWSYDFTHIEKIYESWSPTFRPPQEEIDDIKATFRVPGAIKGALGYYWSFFGSPQSDPTTKITVPSLVIAGEADGAADIGRYAKAKAGFASEYRLETLEGVGHFPQIEAPDEVAEMIGNHLDRFVTMSNGQPPQTQGAP